MTWRIYRSSDTSSPVIDGQVGSLSAWAYAVLVTGYGSLVGAGWTRPYTGTNGAAFKQGSGSNGFYLNLNDNGPGAGGGVEARVVGYETMTAFATGTNLFPTAAQAANGGFVRKSATADATARVWIAAADQRTFYLFVRTGDDSSTWLGWMFGEIYSLKPNDPARTMLIARVTENSSSIASSVETMALMTLASGVNFVNISMHYLARDATGNIGAIAAGKMGDGLHNITYMAGWTALSNPADNRTHVAPIRVTHTVGGNTIRGRLRGLWHFGHPIAGVSDGDTFSGVDFLSGRTFQILKLTGTIATVPGVYVLETSDTVDTN